MNIPTYSFGGFIYIHFEMRRNISLLSFFEILKLFQAHRCNLQDLRQRSAWLPVRVGGGGEERLHLGNNERPPHRLRHGHQQQQQRVS